MKDNFFPGRYFRDIEDLNYQAIEWCRKVDVRPNGTTGKVPLQALAGEQLLPFVYPCPSWDFKLEQYYVEKFQDISVVSG